MTVASSSSVRSLSSTISALKKLNLSGGKTKSKSTTSSAKKNLHATADQRKAAGQYALSFLLYRTSGSGGFTTSSTGFYASKLNKRV